MEVGLYDIFYDVIVSKMTIPRIVVFVLVTVVVVALPELKKNENHILFIICPFPGLTILIPYILSLRSQWSRCKIRIFALTNHQMELEVEEKK